MKWYSKYIKAYNKPFAEGFYPICDEVKARIQNMQSQQPVVTVSVISYNEECHLLACLWALSDMICKYPVEIIGVNNDSKDRTAEIFERCGVPYYNEERHSCGFARLCGLKKARGKYHINIDSDTLYPPLYVETMVDALNKKGIVGACSLWSYIPDENHPAWGIRLFEFMRDIHLWIQHFKRPELSVRGLVFAYETELAKKIGIRTDIIRGEDGFLAFKLKHYGKIAFIRNRKARAITGYGTMDNDGSFWHSFWFRIKKYTTSLGRIFYTKDEYKDDDSNLVK
ncbi:glycosyltransferase family 2 protein [Xylanibacter oryzae]|uniref:glycosyltransferase family 2 protein n=1 Tax=Xylanibacter oryzae TaxID=185293 RepID=UPI0004B56437|nr:glycosyltransferase family 2 protein [Xylanibacter oryzae]